MTDNPFDPGYVEPGKPTSIYEEFDREPLADGEPVKVNGNTYKPKVAGNVRYFLDIEQGSEDWHKARLGLLTASEMKLILTPKLKVADNKEEKTHLYDLLAQRVTDYVEPHFQSYDMERGNFDEEHARAKYGETYAPVTECGFITNDRWGFTLGYSPDGLIGDDGLIEAKSRIQKWQMRTLIECIAKGEIPEDFIIQVQSALLISERKWLDFISYSGGMMMATVRCYPIPAYQDAIACAAAAFEERIIAAHEIYNNLIASDARLIPTERLIHL